MTVQFQSTPVDNKCEGAETMILVNANPDGQDIVLPFDSPRTITFVCEKVIWEGQDYFPERNFEITPGNLAFFNPCLNGKFVKLEVAPIKGGQSTVIQFLPE